MDLGEQATSFLSSAAVDLSDFGPMLDFSGLKWIWLV